MDKIKRFFHSTTPNKKLKKRLSSILLLKSSIVEPRIKDATLSKSTSFLQLQNANAIKRTIKKSRSMFGFDGNQTNNSSGITENTTSTLIINTSSTSVHHTNSSSSILHTAAVSISSAHSTTIQQQLLISKNSGKKPDYLVQLGIQYYEKGEFETAIHYWKLLTTLDQPSSSNRMIGLGIFFYGLALRHGWGCRKSPAIAVRYLQKVATENTTDELYSAIARSCISKSMMTCLAVSIYELGEFFWHGWEVPKSVTIAVYYFQLAVYMGSSQAMNDLGFCYQYGQGVDKDEYQAAQLYRRAAKCGFALEEHHHWIWESQYDTKQKN